MIAGSRFVSKFISEFISEKNHFRKRKGILAPEGRHLASGEIETKIALELPSKWSSPELLNSNSEIKSCTLAFRLIFEWNFRHLLPFFDQFTGGAYPLTLCVHSNTRPTDLQTRRLHLCELSRWNGALLRCQSVPLARCWWTAFDCHLVMAISYSYPLAQGEHRHSVIRFSTRILSLNYLAIFGNFHQTCWPY